MTMSLEIRNILLKRFIDQPTRIYYILQLTVILLFLSHQLLLFDSSVSVHFVQRWRVNPQSKAYCDQSRHFQIKVHPKRLLYFCCYLSSFDV